MASYLDARARQGRWLLRIEDIDKPREVPGAAQKILQTLESLGFEWDGDVIYQSQRLAAYESALAQLQQHHQVYACSCSRSQLAQIQPDLQGQTPYPGWCRHKNLSSDGEVALRVKVGDQPLCFTDRVHGRYCQNLQAFCGDFVIRRKDGLFAYQIAVVIDDADAGITHVVRGDDLIDSTPRQIHLQQLLGLPTPRYAHIPLVLDRDGDKFSKSSFDGSQHTAGLADLVKAWNHLQHKHVETADFSGIDRFWHWAIAQWNVDRVNSTV